VAIDPSAAFKKAITEQLPNAKISVDAFQLVQLANLMGDPGPAAAGTRAGAPRGRKVAPAWANRRLLLRSYDPLSPRARLEAVFATDELSAARGIKKELRRLPKVQTLDQARRDKMIWGCFDCGVIQTCLVPSSLRRGARHLLAVTRRHEGKANRDLLRRLDTVLTEDQRIGRAIIPAIRQG
jgi:hypothetical protein